MFTKNKALKQHTVLKRTRHVPNERVLGKKDEVVRGFPRRPKCSHVVYYINQFCQETTLHGLKYITDKESPIIHRIFWIIISVFGTVIFLLLAIVIWNRFEETPTVTVIDTTNYPVYNIRFPAVTLCNSNKVYKPALENFIKKMDEKGINESVVRKLVRNIPLLLNPENFTIAGVKELQAQFAEAGVKIRDLMKEMMQPCDKMLVKCEWMSDVFNCLDKFRVIMSIHGHCCSFNYHGGNYNLKSHKHHKKDDSDVLRVTGAGIDSALTLIVDCQPEYYESSLHPFYGITVLVHGASDYPETSMMTALIQPGEELAAGLDAKYTASDDKIRGLGLDQRKCWFDDESGDSSGGYSYQTCITECRMKTINKTCGCVPYYYPFHDTKYRVCNLLDVPCLDEHSSSFSGLQPPIGTPGFNKNVKVGMTCKQCHPQCSDESYSLSMQTADMAMELFNSSPFMRGYSAKNLSLIHVFFRDITCLKYIRHPYMTWDSLFASFGGVFGLCLGGSVLSLIEVLYYFTLRLWSEYRNMEQKNTENLHTIEKTVEAWNSETVKKNPSIEPSLPNNFQKAIRRYEGTNVFKTNALEMHSVFI